MEKSYFYLTLLLFFIFLSGCEKKEKVTFNTITISAVGDVNFGFEYPSGSYSDKVNKDFFSQSKKILRASDISFCNLETVLCDTGIPAKKMDGKNTFVFKVSKKFAEVLVDAGFDVVSIANNHIRDFGVYGENETKRVLMENGIQFVSKSGEIAKFTIRGTKIWFVGYSSGYENRSISNPDEVFKEIKNLAEQCDILVVSFHAGGEGEHALHIKNEIEFFLGENRGNVIFLAHGAIDNGADLILMHGPHVPRAVELYKDRFIAYSLGNFVNYGWNLKGSTKVAPLLWIELFPSGKPLLAKIYSFIQNKPGYPEFDNNKTAYKLIKKLTEKDFGSFYFFSE
ncbi:MAG: CapA family protein [Candidatus Omnitrophica bacterium]|nr:CapA family protein [Candidatus Omnitrophota bacterium]MCM8816858.1 CapA family protein [Candidatus Omnitrophota bacterium]